MKCLRSKLPPLKDIRFVVFLVHYIDEEASQLVSIL